MGSGIIGIVCVFMFYFDVDFDYGFWIGFFGFIIWCRNRIVLGCWYSGIGWYFVFYYYYFDFFVLFFYVSFVCKGGDNELVVEYNIILLLMVI